MASQTQRKVPVAHTIKEIGGTPQQEAMVDKIVKAFTITPESLEQITQHFLSEMHKGLNHEEQTIAMIPSFVEGRLTGEETGQFLALDLGGTNLRVVLVELQGRGKFTTKSTKYKVSESLKTGDVKELYSKLDASFGVECCSVSRAFVFSFWKREHSLVTKTKKIIRSFHGTQTCPTFFLP